MTLSFEDGLKQLHKILQESNSSSEDQDDQNPDTLPVNYGLAYPFSSLSASKDDSDSIISQQLTSVRLDKDRAAEYNKTFYPKGSEAFQPIIEELVKVSAQVNGMFSLLRYCLASSRRLSLMGPMERADAINREAERILRNVSGGDRSEIIDNFLSSTNSGKNHVIKPSTRYEGGYDIRFIGSPASPSSSVEASLPSIHVPYGENSVIDIAPGGKSNSPHYQREYLEAYATEFAQNAVAAGEEILQMLVGEKASDYGSAAQRLVRTVPFDFDFRSANEIFFKHTGIVLTVDMMEDIDKSIVQKYGEFFSACVIRTPKSSLINLVYRKMEKDRAEAQEGAEAPPVSASYIEDYVTKEGMALSQVVSLSFAITLPADITRYITQTETSERVPIASLHNWASIWTRVFIRKKGAKMSGGRIRNREIPRFVPPLSKTQNITNLRAQNGFHVEPGKGDDNGIFIAPDGTLQYGLPTEAKADINENLINYERDLDTYLAFCFDHDIPPQSTMALPNEVQVGSADPNVNEQYKKLFNNVRKYSGKLLSYDWDYNNIITAHVTDPTSIVPRDLVGAAKVDSLAIADYLGYNFADEGESPIRKGFADAMVLMTQPNSEDSDIALSRVSSSSNPAAFMEPGGVSPSLLEFYAFQMMKERVPDGEKLFEMAKSELGITELSEYDQYIYPNLFLNGYPDPDGSIRSSRGTVNFLLSCVSHTMRHCNRGPILRQMVANENPGISPGDLAEEVENHPHFFNPSSSPAADFGRLYNYIGGMIFRIAMESLTKVARKDLFSVEEPIPVGGYGNALLHKSNHSQVSRTILPLAIMFSKYIPNKDLYFREAEELVESNKGDPSVDESDIQIAGSVDGAQMFPHQVRAHGSLRKRPAFSILDIAPGGGKTTLGVTDIASMVTELNELGQDKIKPIILCPDGLIKNWVDDMKIFTGNNWNMLPVNSTILSRWGYEKLEETIRNAPPNTIVVCGFQFLNNKKETIVVGTHSVNISNNLEFMKRFGFDYICIDESHKLKKKSSQRHKNIKQFTTGSHVRFLRLATGTLISDRVSDIVGQASLYNGHIFRDGEVSRTAVSDVSPSVSVNGDEVPLWQVDSPQRARQKLGRYASVITMKKKEWAFMLPSPIETFIAVPMVPDNEGATAAEREAVELGEMHKQLYDAVLQESVEELEELLKKAKGRGAGEGDDDEEEEADSDGSPEGADVDLDDADDLAALGATALHPYLARIERLVTNPMADPLAPQIFGAAGVEHYHSTKALYVAKRIDDHFNPTKWEKDKIYKEYTLVDFEGRLFLSRKKDKGSPTPTVLPETTRGVTPLDDTDTWKEEPEGKIVIFCRYTNSVNGIYNALPSEYKKIAVKFTGQEQDKWANLDGFMNDPKIKILVANEMGIAEGHNMQLASRIIRIESPWAPGDLDQASSRIFRPDPKAQKDMVKSGKPGELAREAIFLDWILCDNTMEVAKQARLISKIFNKARFDEAENATYDDVLNEYDLDEIRMSLDTLRSRASLSEYTDYVEAYAALNGIQREEFHEMRATMDHTMKSLEVTPPTPGFAKIQTPFVANQKPDDSEGLNLVTLRNMLRSDEYRKFKDDPSLLKGMPIVTDMGKGRIASVRVRYLNQTVLDEEGNPVRNKPTRANPLGTIKKEPVLDSQGRKVIDPDKPISSMKVKLSGSNDVIDIKGTGDVFMPTTLDSKTAKKDFKVNNLNTTATQERKTAREEERIRQEEEEERKQKEKEEEKALLREERRRKREAQQAKERAAAAEDGKKREENIKDGKPINTGIRPKDNVPPIKRGRIQDEDGDKVVTVSPAYFHGYLTLEMDSDDTDPKLAKKLGFKTSGPYAYVTADRYNRFDKVLDYLESNFYLSDASARRLEEVQDAFDTGPKEIYRMELLPNTSLPMFFAVSKRKVTKRNEIRPYPIIMPDALHIAVDKLTSPAIVKHINKAIPGAVTKWKEHPGHYLFFATTKAELRNKIRELKKAGLTIANEAEAKAEITNIKFRAAKGKK